MAAAQQGSRGLLGILLENKADVNHQARNGRAPLHSAAEYARWAKLEDEHQLALEITKRLIDAGANPNARNAEGESAYDIASSNRGSGQLTAEYLRKLTGGSKSI
jgi:ankyrin repeat protein